MIPMPIIAARAVLKFVRYRSIPSWINFGPSNCENVAKIVNTRFRKKVRLYGRT